MPPRLNKRQLREQEQLAALGVAPDNPAPDSASEESDLPSGSGFAALMASAPASDSSEEGPPRPAKSKKKKKRNKPVPSAPPTPGHEPPASPKPQQATPSPKPAPSKRHRKALKKQKGKDKQPDDIDQALAEMSLRYPDLQHAVHTASASPAARAASTSLAALLALSTQHLDAEAEMRKFFGAKVVSAAKSADASSSSNPPKGRTQQHRSVLTTPQPNWWPAHHRNGLQVRPLTVQENEQLYARYAWKSIPGERWWTVEYSKRYKGTTMQFIQVVMAGDPQGLYDILKVWPYHADTLLQMSEIYFHREEHSSAADFIDRALYTYERAFVGAFNLTIGMNRLDFGRVENRPFFLALHRQVSDLQRRGCVRTAFEFARLLYALDPWTDPHGALLHLDYLALKAGMGQWLLDVWDYFAAQAADGAEALQGRLRADVLPGWAYARALALFDAEEAGGDEAHKRSTEALEEALVAFPSVVPLLADKADISLSAAARAHPAFRIYPDGSSFDNNHRAHSVLHLLSHLYAQRSAPLWKPPARGAWLAATVTRTLPSLPSSFAASPSPRFAAFAALYSSSGAAADLQHAAYRHAVVLEASCRRLFGFIPREVTGRRGVACDPVPPPGRVSEYDAAFFEGAEVGVPGMAAGTGGGGMQRRVRQFQADPAMRRQLQALLQNPEIAQRFPGVEGIVQFLQQVPEDARDDALMQLVMEAQRRGGGMPGAMPGEDADGDGEAAGAAEEEEDEDEDEDDAPLPIRVFRNVFNRFWGGEDAPEEEESDQEGTEHGGLPHGAD